jgi:hypothetical protein
MRASSLVGNDLRRRRTVIVRIAAGGEVLETVRIVNDVERLVSVMAKAGECPEVVLQATHGWYWASPRVTGWWGQRAPGSPVGSQGLRIPPSQERRVRFGCLVAGWVACPRRGSHPRRLGSCVK